MFSGLSGSRKNRTFLKHAVCSYLSYFERETFNDLFYLHFVHIFTFISNPLMDFQELSMVYFKVTYGVICFIPFIIITFCRANIFCTDSIKLIT